MNKPNLPAGVIDLQGRPFPTFAYVLEKAHEKGLKSLVTDLVQIPSAENDWTAITRSTATFEDGSLWTSFGDASPKSVKALLVPAIIRMAETRSMGRALRNATCIGVAIEEEMGDLPGAEQPRANGSQQQPQRPQATRPQEAVQDARQALPPPPKASEVTEEEPPVPCRSEGCGIILSPDEIKGSIFHAGRFKGQFYCRDHGKAVMAAALAAEKAKADEENPDAAEEREMERITDPNPQPAAATGEFCCECGGGPLSPARVKVSQRIHSGKCVCTECEKQQPYLGNRLGHASAV